MTEPRFAEFFTEAEKTEARRRLDLINGRLRHSLHRQENEIVGVRWGIFSESAPPRSCNVTT